MPYRDQYEDRSDATPLTWRVALLKLVRFALGIS